MRGLLAQNEISESLSSDLDSVLALGDVDPLGRSGLRVDAAIRRMHTNLAHASVPDVQRMLMAARAPHNPFWMLSNVSRVLSVLR